MGTRTNRKYYAVYTTVTKLRYNKPVKNGKSKQVAVPILPKSPLKTREELHSACIDFWAPYLKSGIKPSAFKNKAFVFIGFRYGLDGEVHPQNGDMNEIINTGKN